MESRSPANQVVFDLLCTYMLKINSPVEFTVLWLVIGYDHPNPLDMHSNTSKTLGLKSAFAPRGTLQQALALCSSVTLALQLQGNHRKFISLDMGRDPWCVRAPCIMQ